MRYADIFRAWGRILLGYQPVLSIEITKECPLSCSGCYAYHPDHLGNLPLVSLSDAKGETLVRGVMELIGRHRPLVVYIVGGEPLVRYRELSVLLPLICRRDIHVEVVTSAVRSIPREWANLPKLGIVVSIDGLQPEHDARRKPATYERILKHIQEHRIVVHCTVTSQMMDREDYLQDFVEFWSNREEVRSIRVSFFTPQVGETSVEILSREMRAQAVTTLARLRPQYPKLEVPEGILKTYLDPPDNPRNCLFARVTRCVSADLQTLIKPCQFGGNPKCSECGCLASVALHSINQHRLPMGIRVASLFEISDKIGSRVRRLRQTRPAQRTVKTSSRLARKYPPH